MKGQPWPKFPEFMTGADRRTHRLLIPRPPYQDEGYPQTVSLSLLGCSCQVFGDRDEESIHHDSNTPLSYNFSGHVVVQLCNQEND